MAGRLQGKRCLIVGGTSGIGLATARRFVDEGACVVIAGLNPPGEAGSIETVFLRCDATDPAQVTTLVEKSTGILGGLDILFHVAGASGRRHGDASLHDCTDEGWTWTLAANLNSTFHTNRAVIRFFRTARQGGVILNMASALALDPAPRYFDTCAYAASKGGVIALTRHAAARYASEGIRVNALAPGLIDTPMAQRAVQDSAIHAYVRLRQPLSQGPGAANDCAAAAVYLCSEEARMLTGVILPVDGGWCLDSCLSG